MSTRYARYSDDTKSVFCSPVYLLETSNPVVTTVWIISLFYSNLFRLPAYLLEPAPPVAMSVGIIFGYPLSQNPGPCGAEHLVCLLNFCLLFVWRPCCCWSLLLLSLLLVGFASCWLWCLLSKHQVVFGFSYSTFESGLSHCTLHEFWRLLNLVCRNTYLP